MNKKIIGAVVVIVLVLVGIGIGLNHGSSQMRNDMTMSADAVSTDKVMIKNYMFNPMVIKVKVGTTVTWTNHDAVAHTVTADNPSSATPSSMDIRQGSSYSFTFEQAGTYTYHCFPHPYMHGTVIVE
jgi:amicyanin